MRWIPKLNQYSLWASIGFEFLDFLDEEKNKYKYFAFMYGNTY